MAPPATKASPAGASFSASKTSRLHQSRQQHSDEDDSSDTARSSSPHATDLPSPTTPTLPSRRTSSQDHGVPPSTSHPQNIGAQKHLGNHRAALRPALSGRNHSTGKIKLNTSLALRPGVHRAASASLTSPTADSPKASHAVKRTGSAFIAKALNKNYSSGHLPRHNSSKVLAKQHHAAQGHSTRAMAPAMKRSRSGRSEGSQKSPLLPQADHNTVRFDLGHDDDDEENIAAGQAGQLKPGLDDDTEWTDNSTSISPETTRDHTRSNSVIIDHAHGAASKSASTSAAKGAVSEAPRITIEEDADAISPTTVESKGKRRATSKTDLGVLSADALTSLLLTRGAAQRDAQLKDSRGLTSTSTMTAASDPSSVVHVNHKDVSADSSADAPNGAAIFITGPSSEGETPQTLSPQSVPHSTSAKDSHAFGSSGSREYAPRRSRSPNANIYSESLPLEPHAVLRTHIKPGQHDLPVSRTQQRLELDRLSIVQESGGVKHTPPTAGRGFYEVVHRFEGGHSAGGRGKNQLEAIYAIVSKDLENAGRYRQPLEEALKRVTRGMFARTPRSSSVSLLPGSRDEEEDAHGGNSPSRRPSSIRSGKIRSSAASAHREQHSPASDEAPTERSRKRQSHVSFDIPSRGHQESHRKASHVEEDEDEDEDEDEEYEAPAAVDSSSAHPSHRRTTSRERDVAGELCRRMWDLSGKGAGGFER